MIEKYEHKIISIAEVKPKTTNWLWPNYIPYGAITIVQSDPGEGKSTLLTYIASRLTRGEPIFDESEPLEPINVVYQNSEDSLSRTIRPRFEKANADLTRVSIIDESETCLSMQDEMIEHTIRETNAKLFVLDPLQAYLGGKVDFHRANEVRPVMNHLAHIAEKYDCAIVLIGHLNKSSGNKAAYRGLGSIDFYGTARSVLVVGTPQNNPDIRVLAHSKSNLAEKCPSLEFQLNPFKFLGRSKITADELLNSSPTGTKSSLAEKLILEMLADGIAKPQKEFMRKATERDISKRTLDNARQKLEIKSNKHGKSWYWEPKKEEDNITKP